MNAGFVRHWARQKGPALSRIPPAAKAGYPPMPCQLAATFGRVESPTAHYDACRRAFWLCDRRQRSSAANET